MKIYKADGSWAESTITDDAFGWNCNDIILHCDSKYKEPNNKKIDDPEKRASIFVNTIFEYKPESVTEFSLLNENLSEKIIDTDQIIPCKSRILDLINPCNIESKMLLSVVHYALYKTFDINMIKVEPFLTGIHFNVYKDIDTVVYDGISNYHQYKRNNIFPLLMELVLSDNKCDEISFDDRDTVDHRDVIEEDTSKNKNLVTIINMEKICTEVVHMHKMLSDLQKGFQESISYVDTLIKFARTLEKDIRETTFLEDLIHLLNGELEKVVLKESPFRIFLNSDQKHNKLNLII